jgi:dTDP-4-dehydrorhamnose 3,5-epimerase
VNLHRSSSTFGRHVGLQLSASRPCAIFIPPGFAHGILTLSEDAEVLYFCTDNYHPDDEHTLAWDDPQLAIPWPIERPLILSDKDRTGTQFIDAKCYA